MVEDELVPTTTCEPVIKVDSAPPPASYPIPDIRLMPEIYSAQLSSRHLKKQNKKVTNQDLSKFIRCTTRQLRPRNAEIRDKSLQQKQAYA